MLQGKWLVGWMIGLAASSPLQAERYDNHKLIRVQLTTHEQLQAMESMGARPLNCITGVGEMEYVVGPDALPALVRAGIAHEVLLENVQPHIDVGLESMRRAAEQPDDGGEWFANYQKLPNVHAHLESLAALRPDLATTFVAGLSLQGREIRGIRISGPGAPGGKPAVIFSGCQHSREWVAVMVPTYIADALVTRYDTDPLIESLVNQVEFFIVPVVNPDGYEFTYAVGGDRLWRKNRRDNGDGNFGVDLNRNWSVDWNGGHSTSTYTGSDTYVGAAAFSEPETQAMRDFVIARPQIAAHIDFHSYSQLVLQNWAHKNAEATDYQLVDAVGTSMNQAIFAVNSMNYFNGWGGSLLYLASGVFPDWCYGDRGFMGFTIELRDRGSSGFLLPADQILPTCEENLPAALNLAQWVTRKTAFFFPRGVPAVANPGATTGVVVNVHPIADVPLQPGGVKLLARVGNAGPFTQYPMPHLFGNQYQAGLPPAPCGQIIQYYFQAQNVNGDISTSPINAPSAVHQATAVTPAITHDFENASGWTTQLAAVAGAWQHGAPINDANWPYDPIQDGDNSGQCFLTLNQPGTSGLRSGVARLTSPLLDLTTFSNRAVISYSYFLHTTTVGPNDYLIAEISSNDAAGPWVEIARHNTNGSNQWRTHAITQSQLTSLGVAITSTMRLRFTAAEGTPTGMVSIVEAGVDAVRVSSDCGGPPPSCPADISGAGGDGEVNIDDLLAVIGAWGPCPAPPIACPADISPAGGDGQVNIGDVHAVIDAWGPCP